MPYWGPKPDENDFAFGSLGAIFYLIIERMNKDSATVLSKSYPEQSMIASLTCLRLLGEQFPKNLSVHLGKQGYEAVKSAFEEWYAKVRDKQPPKYRNAILVEAKKEFAHFEERILKKYETKD